MALRLSPLRPITMRSESNSTSRAEAPNLRAPAIRVRPLSRTIRRGEVAIIARSSSSSSSSSPSPSPLSGLLSFLRGKPAASEPPPGISFVSGSGREAIEDPSEVAELWRSSGFAAPSPPPASSPSSGPPPRSLSEMTTGLPVSGSDKRRVALGIRYTWRVVAAFAFASDDDEDDDDGDDDGEEEVEEEESGGSGDRAAAAESSGPPPLLLPGPKRRRRKLVGLARLLGDGSFAAHLSDVVVLPQYRNRGIGRALVAAAVKEARREPGASSSLVSWARPGRQRLFLQRCGFRVSVAYRVLRYEGDI